MYKNKTFLAIIPARRNSKRLVRKNILILENKPLISWSIEAALLSKYIDKVIVTSEDNEILTIAKTYGSDILKRPFSLAEDMTSSFDVIEHVIQNTMKKYDYIVLLQPTSPLRNSIHIDEALESIDDKKADAIISVCEMEHSPLWSNVLPKNLSMNHFLVDIIKNQPSQSLEKYYKLNGAIYICKTDKLLKEKSFFLKENIFAYIMNRESSIDIDDSIDFELAKIMIQKKGLNH